MPKKSITSSKLAVPNGHFSQASIAEAKGKLLFISGMTARKADGTIAGIGDVSIQTRQVLDNVKAAVEEPGGTLEDICRVDVYVRNIEHLTPIIRYAANIFRTRPLRRQWSRSARW